MKTQSNRHFANKLAAVVLATSLAATSSGFVADAHAQNAKPPAKPPTAAGKAPAAPAAPAPNLAEAKKKYEEGEKKYKAGDYQGALAAFQAAEAIKSSPRISRYLGLCYDGMQKYPDAVASYEKFLAEVPKGMTGDEIKARVDAIKAMPGKVHVETKPAGATVAIDGKPNTVTTPADLELAPGKHTLKITGPNHEPKEQEIEVAFASTQDVKAELVEKAPVPVTPAPPIAIAPPATPEPAKVAPPPEPRSKLPAYITGGLAVVSAGVGTIFGIMALSDKSDFDKNLKNPRLAEENANDGDNHALVADMAFAAALTLGITSAVLFLTKDEPPPPTAAFTGKPVVAKKKSFTIMPTPIVTPNGGGAGAVIRF